MVFDTKKSLPGGSVPPLSETAFLPLSLGFFVFFVFVFLVFCFVLMCIGVLLACIYMGGGSLELELQALWVLRTESDSFGRVAGAFNH